MKNVFSYETALDTVYRFATGNASHIHIMDLCQLRCQLSWWLVTRQR